jgi:hypothetical protein
MSSYHPAVRVCSDIELTLQQIDVPLEIVVVLELKEPFELHLIGLLGLML